MMACSKIIPLAPTKACSCKCKSDSCGATSSIWVVAACEGMIALFEKNMDGSLIALSCDGGHAVFSSLEQFQEYINQAIQAHAFDQFIIIGSRTDIAWTHVSLPSKTMQQIVAEIEYPLLAAWFRQSLPLPHLTKALGVVFTA